MMQSRMLALMIKKKKKRKKKIIIIMDIQIFTVMLILICNIVIEGEICLKI